MRNILLPTVRQALKFSTILLLAFYSTGAFSQSGTAPSANCHVTDAQFSACPNGSNEWLDVQQVFFPASNSFLYVNQDPARQFIWLLYDFPFQKRPVGPTESVRISFDTVEADVSGAKIEHYDIDLFGDGHILVNVFGQPEDPGRIAGAVGFHDSPNSGIPHLIAELQVPLTPGVPTTSLPIRFSGAPALLLRRRIRRAPLRRARVSPPAKRPPIVRRVSGSRIRELVWVRPLAYARFSREASASRFPSASCS